MLLTKFIKIKKSDTRFDRLNNICVLSKILFNKALNILNKYFKLSGNLLKYNELYHLIKSCKAYKALPRKVSQQILICMCNSIKEQGKPCKYLKKNYIAIFGYQSISFKNMMISIMGISFQNVFNLNKNELKSIRLVPYKYYIKVEFIYEVISEKHKENNNYLSIDLGMNNLAACVSNVSNPFLINGKPLKSIIAFYHKKIGRCTGKNRERQIEKRNNKILDMLHKITRYIINYMISNNISNLIVGKNKNWKANGSFLFKMMPHHTFISQLKYKCELAGLNFSEQEESYTSKFSFLDNEKICKHSTYLCKRVKRGLFESSNGKKINADVNGSANILKKYFQNSKKAVGNLENEIMVGVAPKLILIN